METTTRAERQAIAQVFQQFDKDCSGTMDVSELSLALAHLGIFVEEDQLSELVLQVEVNDNNEIFLDGFGNLIALLKGAARYQLVGSSLRSRSGEFLQKAIETKLLSSDAIWRFFFDGLVMLTAYLLSVIIVLDSVLLVETATEIIQIIATVVFFLDIVVSACTYRDRDDLWHTLTQYATGWLIPDVFAMLPWGLMLPGTAGRVGRYANWILKMFKGPYLWRNSDKSVMTEQYINYYFKVLPISLLVALFGFMVHVFTVVFVYIKRSRGEDSFTYDEALYFVIYTLCTVGFGDPPVIGDSIEQLYACAVLCGAIFCNGYIIATFVTILQRADIHQDRRGKLRETLAVLEHFSMPPALQDEVLQFQDHMLGHSLSKAYASVVEGLPEEMRNNIDVAVKLRMIDTAPFLASLHDLLRIALTKELGNAVVKPEQNLFVQGEPCKAMVFIAHGLVDLIHRGGVQHTKLRTGQYFGVSTLLAREKEIVIASDQPQNHSHDNDDVANMADLEAEDVNNNHNDESNLNNNNQQQQQQQKATTIWKRIFPKHTVSAKAVSYCDLWTLKGSSVIAMSKRFVQLKYLIQDLHDEFKANPFIFNCIVPPDSMFEKKTENDESETKEQNQKNRNNEREDNNSIKGTQNNSKEASANASTPLTPTTLIFNNNNNNNSNNNNQEESSSPFLLEGRGSTQNPLQPHPNKNSNNDSGSLQKNTTAVFEETTNKNNNNGNDNTSNSVSDLVPQEDRPNSRITKDDFSGNKASHHHPLGRNNEININNNNVNDTNNALQQQPSGSIFNFNFEDYDDAEDVEDTFNNSGSVMSSSNNNNNSRVVAAAAATSGVATSKQDQQNHHRTLSANQQNNNNNKENSANVHQLYIQTIDSLPTNVRVHSLTERLHICHARVRMLLGVNIQRQQKEQQQMNNSGGVSRTSGGVSPNLQQ